MSSVDDRIVNMQFNNKQFTAGATQTQKDLQTLEQQLAKTGSSGGLTQMGAAVDGVTSRFGAMKVAGVAAIATIASQATMAGMNLLKSMTIDPLIAGFQEYELNLKSVQTIMANTGEGIKTVNKYLDDLNHYSDQTIYNFSQMAQNIGRFTAAGVELPAATDAIKGMANAAALTGADANQLNMAMYQMSQALSTGTIKLMDWNSLVNANMGTENIRNSLQATAMTMKDGGAAMEAATANGVAFRDSLQAGWLTADIFTKTMKVMAGTTLKAGDLTGKTAEELKKLGWEGKRAGDTVAFTVEQLREMGYSKEAAEELNRLSAAAIDSATKIKTFTQLIDVVKESIGSGFAKVFQGLFGNLKQAGELWTGVGNKITDAVKNIFGSVNQMLKAWQKAGGYEAMWAGFGNIFQAIGNLLSPFVEAFKALFPATEKSGEGLAKLSKGFESGTAALEKFTRGAKVITPYLVAAAKAVGWLFSQMGNLLGVTLDFAGQGVDIAKNFLGGIIEGLNVGALKSAIVDLGNNIVNWIKDTLGIHSPADSMLPVGEGIVLGIAQGIVDTVQTLYAALGTLVTGLKPIVSDILSNIIGAVKEYTPVILSEIGGLLSSAFNALPGLISSGVEKLSSALSGATSGASDGASKFFDVVGKIGDAISTIFEWIGKAFSGISDGFSNLFDADNALQWATVIQAIFGSALILTMRNFFKQLKDWSGIKETFGELTDTLSQMQQTLKAQAIMAIAIAVGVLVASIVALTFFSPKQLATSVGTIAILIGMLVASMKSLNNLETKDNATGILQAAGAMAIMSIAIANMAAAIVLLGKQDMATLGKGIGAVAASLGLMLGTLLAFSKWGGEIAGVASSILIMSFALSVLVGVVLAFGKMDMDTLIQGIGGMAFALGMLVGALTLLSLLPPGSVEGMAASLLVMAISMVVLAKAVKMFGSMDIMTLVKGLSFMAIGLAMMVVTLAILAQIAPQVIVVAASMLIMGVAMIAFAKAVGMLGNMSMESLAKGLTAIGIGFAILIAAAIAAMVVAPGLSILSTALLLMGAGLFLAGAGMLAFATGLAILVAVGTAAFGVITIAIQAFLALIPTIAVQLAAGFVSFIETIAAASPRIAAAFNKIFNSMITVVRNAIPKIVNLVVLFVGKLIDGITKLIPKFGRLISQLIETGLKVITKAVPQYVDAGVTIVTKILEGLAKKMPKMLDAAGDLIVAFIRGLGQQATKVADAAGETLLDFLQGIHDAIDKYATPIRNAGLSIAWALINGLTGGLLDNGIQMVRDAATQIAESLPGWMKKVLGIDSPSKVTHEIGMFVAEGLARGMIDGTTQAVQAVISMANAVIAAGNDQVLKAQKAARAAQSRAYRDQARADLLAENAAARAKYARQHEKDKEAQKRAKAAQKAADKAQRQADASQRKADSAVSRVDRVRQFQEADLHGKGDIKSDNAVALADKANKMLQQANAEAARARELMKTNRQAGRKLLEQSRKTARDAEKLAKDAAEAKAKADKFYAMEVEERIKQIEKERAAEAKAAEDQAAYDAADARGKSEILTKRAEANEKKAEAQKKLSEQLMKQAKKLAKTDAAKAMKLLDKAEEAAQKAEDAANQAKQDRDQAKQVLTGGSTTGSSGGSLTPSASVLEDAAKAIDRYTASLQLATELAAADQGPVQFVQNNYSPESLSTIEIYRQSKNLVAAAEVKMGAPKTP